MFLLLCVAAVVLQCTWCFDRSPTDAQASTSYCENANNQSHLNSFLWKVERDPPAYFFGTIHVPYTKVWDYIPANTKHAFEATENIFFELDLTNHYTISALAHCQLLPDGGTLADILPPDIYQRLKSHLEYVKERMPSWITADQRGRGLYADYLFNAIAGNWERKRPVWVMLMVNSLTESDIKSRGIPVLDLFLSQEAERLNKRTGAVERVEEQCIPLNELNVSQVVFALNQTLWQHESYRRGEGTIPYTTEDLILHYNCGDLNAVIFNHDTAQVPKIINSSMPGEDMRTAKTIDDYFRQELIYTRNKRMAQRVMRLLKAHPKKSFFFAFGAGHFLGNNTILHQLSREGFQPTHVKPWHQLPRTKHRKKNRRKDTKDTVVVPGIDLHPLDPYKNSKIYKKRYRKRNRRKKKRKHHNNNNKGGRVINDLWVRIQTTSEEPVLSTTPTTAYPYNEYTEVDVYDRVYDSDTHRASPDLISLSSSSSSTCAICWQLAATVLLTWTLA